MEQRIRELYFYQAIFLTLFNRYWKSSIVLSSLRNLLKRVLDENEKIV